jgi:TRAP-type C4-dicarboxylate transport system permease small subunit
MDFFYPTTVHADLDSFLGNVNEQIINPLITLLFALAIAYFLWGAFEFFLNQENEEKKTTGKSHMLWGVVGITIMMGVFMIMNVILSTFNIKGIDPEEGTVNLD